ncbi:MAG: F0F1 ATP synthase subunit A [Ilumatobacteraceae bacterium]
MFGLDFPPINEVIRWRDAFGNLNKIGMIAVLASGIAILIFLLASRYNANEAPKGARNLAEMLVEFIEENIVMQTIGKDGLGWTPFLLSLFIFIYLCNLPGIIPILQMPATGRMAIPLFLSVIVWVVYNAVGIKHQGFIGYFKGIMFPPGVPKPIYLLLTPIELVSTIIVRPFSLAIRLFANMLAGHMLLVTFALLSAAMFEAQTKKFLLVPMGILPIGMLIFLTVFEVLVGFLQAYIFTILTAVYIGGARHPEH